MDKLAFVLLTVFIVGGMAYALVSAPNLDDFEDTDVPVHAQYDWHYQSKSN